MRRGLVTNFSAAHLHDPEIDQSRFAPSLRQARKNIRLLARNEVRFWKMDTFPHITLLPFSMSARSHTATSLAYDLNSFTWVSSSLVQRFTISSTVFPRSIEGGATATFAGVVKFCGAVVDPRAGVAPFGWSAWVIWQGNALLTNSCSRLRCSRSSSSK